MLHTQWLQCSVLPIENIENIHFITWTKGKKHNSHSALDIGNTDIHIMCRVGHSSFYEEDHPNQKLRFLLGNTQCNENFQFSHLNESVRELYTGKAFLADSNHNWESKQEVNWAALDKFMLCFETNMSQLGSVIPSGCSSSRGFTSAEAWGDLCCTVNLDKLTLLKKVRQPIAFKEVSTTGKTNLFEWNWLELTIEV